MAAIAALVATRGGEPPQRSPTARAPSGLAIGLAEQNPHLVRPGAVPARFAPWRDRAAALRPAYFRLLVPWSKVQPDAGSPPDWSATADGCLRGTPPCAAYGGVRDLLGALARRQAADGGWEVVVSPYAAPAWALEAADGCPAGGRVRLAPYRALLRSLRRVAEQEGVALRWWSPWNEPNHPDFLAPQRRRCDSGLPTLAAGRYAGIVRAAVAEMPPGARLVLGEAAGFDAPRPNATGAAELAAALPRDLVCAAPVWGQHAYVGRGSARLAAERDAGGHTELLASVTRALDAHRCPRRHRVWITETGVAPRPGACRLMHRALRAWARHPRVDAAFQYTFREDTLFRVGLADARLRRTLPAYQAWRAWSSRDARSAPAGPC